MAKHTFGPESVSEENVITAFEPILRMAKDPKMESQMEASRIICENSIDENIQQLLCDHGFLETLRDLATSSSSDWAKQHAVAAVANLSDNSACQVNSTKTSSLLVTMPCLMDNSLLSSRD